MGRADGAGPRCCPRCASSASLATEAGPDGYLGDDPDAAAALVRSYGLRLIGGFVPTVLHRPGALEPVERAAALFAAAGADVLVVAAATGVEGYDSKPVLSPSEWDTLLSGLDAAREICGAHGLRCALHPHVGTMVEGPSEIDPRCSRAPRSSCAWTRGTSSSAATIRSSWPGAPRTG